MKITNWCRKLAAALIAGGLLVPCAANAAGLNTNLVVNGDFESVDPATTCCYSAVKLLSWADGTESPGFAYNYSQAYDKGGPLAGGGKFYFTSNGDGGDNDDPTGPGEIAQRIDVSTGPTAIAIAAGTATFNLSAFFTGYMNDGDFGNVHINFLNSASASLGTALLTDDDPLSGWSQKSTSGNVPVGTATLLVSLYGTPVTFGPDGYIDNVDLRISVIPEPSTVLLAGIGVAGAGLSLRRRRDES
jgi:hypothetical protein